MKVFVTGGTGLIGSSLIPRLLSAGHTVTALTRSDTSATKAKSLGATPIMGSHLDLDVLSKAAADADGVVHLAFDHDNMSEYVRICAEDRAAIKAMCDALGTTGKPFVCAGGALGTDGATEECPKIPNPNFPRYLSEDLVNEYAKKGVRGTTVRIAPVAHGPGYQHPFVAVQIQVAKEHGEAWYVGKGDQLWSSIHVKDCAEIFALALEKGEAGKVYHAAAEEGIKVKDISEFVAGKLGVEAKSMSQEEVMGRYGFIGAIMGMSGYTTSDLTQKWLGWKPEGYGLFKALEGYTY
jgi:nucleoside-diphosphate-sugar epimerase